MNIGISDLWFNYDKSAAESPRGIKGEFTGYDSNALLECADNFAIILKFAGIEPFSGEELISDFYNRL